MWGARMVFCTMLLGSAAGMGCDAPAEQAERQLPEAARLSSDSVLVAGIVDRIIGYYNAGAFDSLAALLTPDFVQVEGGQRLSADQYVAFVRGQSISDASVIGWKYRRIGVGSELAYLGYSGTMGLKAGGREATVDESGTLVLRRVDGIWRIALWYIEASAMRG